MINYKQKYMKWKNKYLNLKFGGGMDTKTCYGSGDCAKYGNWDAICNDDDTCELGPIETCELIEHYKDANNVRRSRRVTKTGQRGKCN